jgi:hypothetical protein
MMVKSSGLFLSVAGKMAVYVSGQQPHQTRTTGSNVLQANFQIEGEKHLGMF